MPRAGRVVYLHDGGTVPARLRILHAAANEDATEPAGSPAPAKEPRGAMRTLSQITQRLRRILRRKGRSSEDAEDLVQDAMLKYEIYQRDQAVHDPEAFITRTAWSRW